MINSVGAHGEGNQVWLILAGGALFCRLAQSVCSGVFGFYVAMILVLCSLSSARWPLIIAEKSPMHAGVKCGTPVWSSAVWCRR
ncbi:hypothetical protein ACLBOM_23245 [Escherichia coli]